MMNALVAGLRLITTRKYCPASTRPSNISLCHVFGHFYLMLAEGCRIWAIAEALAPWPGWRRTLLVIVFYQFSHFLNSTEYGVARAGLSELSCFYE